MKQHKSLMIFGEVLFDCFPDGSEVLGGAPFNVAWHLQAFGNQPLFISRVGDDDAGKHILNAMHEWHMDTAGVQLDKSHPSGRVQISMHNNEPQYEIVEHSAYDYIDKNALPASLPVQGLLYHGTLALRNETSRQCYDFLTSNSELDVFLDINLREPWWQMASVEKALQRARWVKINEAELKILMQSSGEVKQQMQLLQQRFDIELLIVTLGSKGAIAADKQGFCQVSPSELAHNVTDTVGAGDAFTSMCIHGLNHNWPLRQTLEMAQSFASKVITLRGATTNDSDFYQQFIDHA